MKRYLLVTVIVIFIWVLGLSAAFAGELDLQLVTKTDSSQGNFGTGSYPASTVVYAGDVLFQGTKIGAFTATSTGTTYTGIDGVMMQYDVMIPPVPNFGDSPSEFFSVKTNHVITGVLNPATVDRGVIYAASPALKSLTGLEVVILGTTLEIMY
jgi:hypothetical protein